MVVVVIFNSISKYEQDDRETDKSGHSWWKVNQYTVFGRNAMCQCASILLTLLLAKPHIYGVIISQECFVHAGFNSEMLSGLCIKMGY